MLLRTDTAATVMLDMLMMADRGVEFSNALDVEEYCSKKVGYRSTMFG